MTADFIPKTELEKKHNKSEKELFSVIPYHQEEAEKIAYSEYSYWGSVLKNFLKNKAALAMICVYLFLLIFSFVAEHIGQYTIDTITPVRSLKFMKPCKDFWFGTDALGRDYWCQVWYATKVSIGLSFLVAVGEAVVGVTIGRIWGYVRKLDRFFTELYNIINNVPTIIYMTLIALMIGQSFTIMCVSLICLGWLPMARNVRNLVFMYRDREYNLASRCLGTSLGRMLIKNILPYLVSVIVLRLALSIPGTISWETTLSYLGLGLGVETPSLGILLRDSRSFFIGYPYLLVIPAIIVSLITITFYLVGNAFSDACDPRNHV